jgi:hypothetical protein
LQSKLALAGQALLSPKYLNLPCPLLAKLGILEFFYFVEHNQ